MAIAALVLWLCTAAVGGYLLATGTRIRAAGRSPADPGAPGAPGASEAAGVPASAAKDQLAAGPAAASANGPAPMTATAARPRRDKDRFDPPSLQRAKNEPLPGLRALAEFTHPALAIIGLAFWMAYVMSRDRVFAAISFGIVLGAICAGVTWVASNARAAKRVRPATADSAADSTTAEATGDALSFSPRVLLLHAAGAVLTLLIVALITARA